MTTRTVAQAVVAVVPEAEVAAYNIFSSPISYVSSSP
jgi:hypothetical protein